MPSTAGAARYYSRAGALVGSSRVCFDARHQPMGLQLRSAKKKHSCCITSTTVRWRFRHAVIAGGVDASEYQPRVDGSTSTGSCARHEPYCPVPTTGCCGSCANTEAGDETHHLLLGRVPRILQRTPGRLSLSSRAAMGIVTESSRALHQRRKQAHGHEETPHQCREFTRGWEVAALRGRL